MQKYQKKATVKIAGDMMMLACCLQFFALQFNLFARIVYYFSVAMIVFIPNIISGIQSKEIRVLLIIVVCILATLYFLLLMENDRLGVLPYYFIWKL